MLRNIQVKENIKLVKVESTPRNTKMRKTPSIFNFKGTFYAKKGIIGVDSNVYIWTGVKRGIKVTNQYKHQNNMA